MRLAARKFVAPAQLGFIARPRVSPELSVIEGGLAGKAGGIQDTPAANIGTAALATYSLVFLAHAIAAYAF